MILMAESFSFLACLSKKQPGQNQYGEQQIRLRFEQPHRISMYNVFQSCMHLRNYAISRIVTFLINLNNVEWTNQRREKSTLCKCTILKRLVDKYF